MVARVNGLGSDQMGGPRNLLGMIWTHQAGGKGRKLEVSWSEQAKVPESRVVPDRRPLTGEGYYR